MLVNRYSATSKQSNFVAFVTMLLVEAFRLCLLSPSFAHSGQSYLFVRTNAHSNEKTYYENGGHGYDCLQSMSF